MYRIKSLANPLITARRASKKEKNSPRERERRQISDWFWNADTSRDTFVLYINENRNAARTGARATRRLRRERSVRRSVLSAKCLRTVSFPSTRVRRRDGPTRAWCAVYSIARYARPVDSFKPRGQARVCIHHKNTPTRGNRDRCDLSVSVFDTAVRKKRQRERENVGNFFGHSSDKISISRRDYMGFNSRSRGWSEETRFEFWLLLLYALKKIVDRPAILIDFRSLLRLRLPVIRQIKSVVFRHRDWKKKEEGERRPREGEITERIWFDNYA